MLAVTQKPSVRASGPRYLANARRSVSVVRVAETDAAAPSSKPKFPDIKKEEAVAVLKAAAKNPGSVKPSVVLTSILGLEKLKLKVRLQAMVDCKYCIICKYQFVSCSINRLLHCWGCYKIATSCMLT